MKALSLSCAWKASRLSSSPEVDSAAGAAVESA
jgi:hypothetical protein